MAAATTKLRAPFLAALSAEAREAITALPPGELEDVLRGHLEQARLAWPDIDVLPASFAAHLARHVGGPASLEALREQRASDLYLACACADGDEDAILIFERVYFVEVDFAAARMRGGETVADEVKQLLRRMLFVSEPGRTAAITDYAGRGDLRGWVRISAMRAAQRLLKRGRREVELDDETLFSVLSPAEDPELRYLRDRYRDAFVEAFRGALSATPAEERRLLRYQLVDGLTIDDLAKLLRVHRATAARRLAAARAGILERTRDALRERLGVAPEELDSIIRLMHSRLDVSIERMLR